MRFFSNWWSRKTDSRNSTENLGNYVGTRGADDEILELALEI